MTVRREKAIVTSTDGWFLEVERFHSDDAKIPIVMFPGYCMNSFVLGYHPRGVSIAEYFAMHGHETFTANLRGQGNAHSRRRNDKNFGFEELVLADVPRVLDWVRETTGRDELIVVGASLGATFLFGYLAHHTDDHGLSAVVSLGGPLRWNSVHPLVKAAFFSPKIASMIPIRKTRSTAQRLLPIVKRMPSVLSIYMNTERIDLSKAHEFVKTVDDPIPYLNGQIGEWVKSKDLTVNGVNVTDKM